MSDIDETLKERGSRYGEFDSHAEVTQAIKVAMASGNNWNELADDMKEAMEMVAHKFGRILNGDPFYIDSWTDCIGYLRLVERRLIDAKYEADEATERAAEGPSPADIANALNVLLTAGVIKLTDADT